jgi:hypothetical protein
MMERMICGIDIFKHLTCYFEYIVGIINVIIIIIIPIITVLLPL